MLFSSDAAGLPDSTSGTLPPTALLTYRDGAFLRAGRTHQILSGSLHYFRVHPEHWSHRVARLAELGLNTIDTYIAWNFHQPHRDAAPRFDGWRDLERFLGIAAENGLDVIVRPGPYICAEWDNGGLPAWLTGTPGIQIRSRHPAYLDAVARWFDELVPRLASLQHSAGGPIVAVQVENEYGSYADDAEYLQWMRRALTDRGITELLYTADGPTELMQDGGSIPGVLASATLGSKPAQAAELLHDRRAGEPFLVAEFWNGWFDHWAEKHHVRAAPSAAATLGEVVDAGGSISIYMAHGGTNFGLWAGANHDGERLQPTITSYDSDAPVAENGAPTPKYFAIRERLLGPDAPPLAVAQPALLPEGSLPIVAGAALLPALRAASAGVLTQRPATFEELDQPSGLVLYRARPQLPAGDHAVALHGVHDRAQVYLDGELLGIVEHGEAEFPVSGPARRSLLEVLVENQGRINYGPLVGQGKGILGCVQIDRRIVLGWEAVGVPIDEWDAATLDAACASAPAGQCGFATATLPVEEPADAFLAFPGFGKGFVWVNGFLLGRYWSIGPQRTLYLPGPLLHRGANRVAVLELQSLGATIETCAEPQLGTTEEYVEEF